MLGDTKDDSEGPMRAAWRAVVRVSLVVFVDGSRTRTNGTARLQRGDESKEGPSASQAYMVPSLGLEDSMRPPHPLALMLASLLLTLPQHLHVLENEPSLASFTLACFVVLPPAASVPPG